MCIIMMIISCIFRSFNADNKRNIVVDGVEEHGDVEKEFAESEVIAEGEYEVQAQEQCMMESFRTYTYLDHMNRLVVVSSTQVPFMSEDPLPEHFRFHSPESVL